MNNPATAPNRRVLIIDDSRAIHEDFRKILSPGAALAALEATAAELFGQPASGGRRIQFEIDSAYQGQEGARLVQQALAAGRPYAMAFVDIRMPPGWDGVETTQKIWELDPHLQVVLCTAYSDYSWSEMFEKLGNRDGLLILKKPFDAVEALQLAHALTEKWRLHQQSRQKMKALEDRVAERTNELQQTNRALQTEVTDHTRAEAALLETSALLETLLENTTDYLYFKDRESRFVHFSREMLKVFHLTRPDELKGKTNFDFYAGEHARPAFEAEQEIIRTGKPILNLEEKETHRDGRITWALTSKMPWRDKAGNIIGTMGISKDITRHKHMETQLFQAQKMETVGKLAGGVAHEFNSILTAIIGQSELLLGDLPAGSPLAENATEISRAAGRAATLTRQLLAYGRKQFLHPNTLDLNRVIAGMEGMFRHLMGDDVDMQIVPAPGLHLVKADAGQLEQVIMNMAINAREAMPHGGKLTLETANVSLDRESVGQYPELKPGDYVMLAITDTGTGMSEEIKARVFEPFFTTKDVGQGTGLGLSTCYGIVKQSGGHISVYSEPGRGTTFKIYLPQAGPAANPRPRLDSPDLPRGTETILLVEDDPALREMAAMLLGRLGYTVLTAANGVEALNLQQQRAIGPIDLLFTDVVMPHMSGKELADQVRALYPHTRILFTSAYTENAIVHQGVLEKGVALLQKPFTPSALARKLREVLDSPAAPKPDPA